MKRAFTLLGLLASISAGAATNVAAPGSSPLVAQATAAAPVRAAAADSPRTNAAGAQLFTLANGMQLIVQPDHRAPTAVHMVWLRVGSMDEVDGTSGVAHVLEHMMFKGSKTVAPGDFSRRVAALGGRENAFTSRDYTGYYQQIPAQKLEDVMRLESDRFANMHWPDEEFKKEIEVVKEERRLRTEDQPRALLAEQLAVQEKQLQFDLRNARESYLNQVKNLDVARRVYGNLKLKFEQGLISGLDIVTADNNYLRAETDYLSAVFQVLQASNELDKIYGNLK